MATPAAAYAAKTAVSVLTDKRLRNAVIGIVLGFLILLVAPASMLLSVVKEGARLDFNAPGFATKLMAGLSDEDKAKLAALEGVMKDLEKEQKDSATDPDFIKVQIIYLCAFQGKENDSDTFISDFISCFAGAADDKAVYDNLEEKFAVTLTQDQRTQISDFYNKVIEMQLLPPTSLHNWIGSITNGSDVEVSDEGFASPFHDRNSKNIITSGYGRRIDPVTGQRGALHAGLDMGVPVGTSVYPVKSGKVISAVTSNPGSGYGNYIVIDHGGGYASLYGHCSQLLASVGDKVTTQTVIAKSGNTGKSTGPHLHLEIIIKGQPVNPVKYLP